MTPTRLVPITAALIASLSIGCKSKAKPVEDAGLPVVTKPTLSDSALIAKLLDAGAPPVRDAGPPPVFDGGTSACRLLDGPLQQPFTGPARLVASESGMDVVVQKSGTARIFSIPAEPPARAKPSGRRELPAADKASRPPCAAAGPYLYCSDAKGSIHRALRTLKAEQVIAEAEPGGSVSAAAFLGGHVAVGYLGSRMGDEGRVSEAYVKVDDEEPVRVSEDGAGATEIQLAPHGREVVALVIDARRAMSPVHARMLRVDDKGKLVVGPDAVVYVGGGASHQVHGALGVRADGVFRALIPTSTEDGFGLVTVQLEAPPRTDSPSSFSPYPNGINAAPIAATVDGKQIYVARVRPLGPEPGSTHALEIGKLDDAGKFASLGIIGTSGSVSSVDVALDKYGAVWLHYTDAAGSWVERRACP